MTSAIVRTNPTSGTATTSSVRDNFGFAADEINVLQRSSTELKLTTGGGASPYSVNFGSSPTFSLVDGARISVRINATNTSSPNITVSPGISPVGIVKSDGSALVAGDLVADSIYDLMYNDIASPRWVALNVDVITSQDALLTTILGGLYPVGGLLTTTNSANPGDADYFFSGITFGTWEAYAQGRTIVGIDTGTAITLASSASNVVTLTVASHSLSAGDLIAVSGFTSDTDANGEFTVDSTTPTTIVYTATNVSDGTLTGSSLLVKNIAFDTAQEVGGVSSEIITLTKENLPEHTHRFMISGSSTGSGGTAGGFMTKDPGIIANGTIGTPGDTAGTQIGSQNGTTGQPLPTLNNLQPYITTYIWKRVVTP
jgi:hypothetical protein